MKESSCQLFSVYFSHVFKNSPHSPMYQKKIKREKRICVTVCVSVLLTVKRWWGKAWSQVKGQFNTKLHRAKTFCCRVLCGFELWSMLCFWPHFCKAALFCPIWFSIKLHFKASLFSLYLKHGLYTLLSPPVKCWRSKSLTLSVSLST